MANTIQIKRNTSGVPSGLQAGELAVNLTDKKLYVGNATANGVLHLNNHLPLAGGTITGDTTNGQFLTTISNTGTQSEDNGLLVTTATSHTSSNVLKVESTGNANTFIVKGNGNIGVGVSSGAITSKLYVGGSFTATGTINAVGIIASSSVAAVGLTTSSGFTLTGGDAYFQGSGGVNFNGGPVSSTAPLTISTSTNKILRLNPTIGVGGSLTSIAFQRGGTDKWRIFQYEADTKLSFHNDIITNGLHQFALNADGSCTFGGAVTATAVTLTGDITSGNTTNTAALFSQSVRSGTVVTRLTADRNGSEGFVGTNSAHDFLLKRNNDTRVTLSGSSVVVNDLGQNIDFRVEGDGDANLIRTDASNDRVGIKTSAPAYTFHCVGTGYFSQSVTLGSGLTVAGNTALTGTLTIGGTIASTSDMILDSADGIVLDADGGAISLKDNGTRFGIFENSSNHFVIQNPITDADIFLKVKDGSSTITALSIDASDAGAATFNGNLTAQGILNAASINTDLWQGQFRSNTTYYNADTDADDMRRLGFGYYGRSAENPNFPTAYGVIQNFENYPGTMGDGSKYIHQLLFVHATGNSGLKVRDSGGNGTTWTDWYDIWHSGNSFTYDGSTFAFSGIKNLVGTLGTVSFDAAGNGQFFSRNSTSYIQATGGTSSGLNIGGRHSLVIATGDSITERVRINSSGHFSVNSTDLSSYGHFGVAQPAGGDTDGIAVVNGSASFRLWVDDAGNRRINAGSASVVQFNSTSFEVLQSVTASGTGHLFGKLNVGSVNNSFDFYNNGTTYLNGAVTVDNNLTVNGLLYVKNSAGNTNRFILNEGIFSWGNSANAGQMSWDTGKAYLYGQSGHALCMGSNGNGNYMHIKTNAETHFGASNGQQGVAIHGNTSGLGSIVGVSRDGSAYKGLEVNGSPVYLKHAGATRLTTTNDGVFVSGSVTRLHKRGIYLNNNYPLNYSSEGETVWSINPQWSDAELQSFFNSTNVNFQNDSTAPAGYSVYIAGNVNVGGTYGSPFPMIPVEENTIIYCECWVKDAGAVGHYMGSQEFSESFGQPSSGYGNPGSFGYWVMVNTSPGTAGWTKVKGYLGPDTGSSTGQWETGTKYFTPQALFNYSHSSGTRGCYISGWKYIKVSQAGNRTFSGDITVKRDGGRIHARSNDYLLCTLGNWGSSGANLDAGQLALYNAGNEKIRLTSIADSFIKGKLLIEGTASYLLDVQQTATAWTGRFENNGGAFGLSIDTINNIVNDVPNLACYTPTGTGVFVSNRGRLGVGMTAPDSKINVLTTTGDYAAHFESTSSTPYGVWIEENHPNPSAAYPLLTVTNQNGTASYFKVNSGGVTETGGDFRIGPAGANTKALFLFDTSGGYFLKYKSVATRSYTFEGTGSSADYATSFSNAGAGNHNLNVHGSLAVTPNSHNILDLNTPSGNHYAMLRVWPNGTQMGYIRSQTNKNLIFDNSSGTQRMVLKEGGYVDMAGASQVRLTLGSTGTAGTNSANWIRGNGSDLGFNAAGGNTEFEKNGTLQFKIDSSANILQLGSSPEYHFGTTGSGHYNWRMACQEDVDGGFEIASGTTSAGSGATNDTYTNRFVIKASTGNCGIGLTPTANFGRLQVYATGNHTNEQNAAFTIGDNATGGMRIYGGVNNSSNYSFIGSVESGTAYRSLILQPNGSNVCIGNVNTALSSGTTNSLRVTTNSGQLEIGPQNGTFCHMTTNVTGFWFNKQIYSNENILPYNNNQHTCGTAANRWANVYSVLGNFSGNLTIQRSSGNYMQIGHDSNSHYISTTGSNRTLNISASGTLDWYDLQLSSDGHLSINSTDAAAQLTITPSGTNANARINIIPPGTGRAIFQYGGTERISYNATGVTLSGSSTVTDSATVSTLNLNNTSGHIRHIDFARTSYATARIQVLEPAALHTGSMGFWTSNASGGPNLVEAMKIDQNQNIGIGVSPNSTYRLRVNGTTGIPLQVVSTNNNCNIVVGSSTQTQYSNIQLHDNGGNAQIWKAGTAYSGFGGANSLNIYASNGKIAFHPNGTANKVVIDTNGRLGLGSTSPAYTLHCVGTGYFSSSVTIASGLTVASNAAVNGYFQLAASATPTSSSSIGKLYAYNNAGAQLNYKDGYNTNHALHSASDYRLKENITDYSSDDAVALVKAAQVKRFDYIEGSEAEENRTNRVGFLAHELQEAGCDLGAVVSLEKDAVDNLGNPRMQSVDYKNLVPVLWAALQDALKRIEELENK